MGECDASHRGDSASAEGSGAPGRVFAAAVAVMEQAQKSDGNLGADALAGASISHRHVLTTERSCAGLPVRPSAGVSPVPRTGLLEHNSNMYLISMIQAANIGLT